MKGFVNRVNFGWVMSAVIAVVMASGSGVCAQSKLEFCQDSPQKIFEAVRTGQGVLLDVREPSEWQAGYLKQARLLSVGSIKKMSPQEVAGLLAKDVPVYIHCEVGARSMDVARHLRGLGYTVKPLRQNCRGLAKGGFEFVVPPQSGG